MLFCAPTASSQSASRQIVGMNFFVVVVGWYLCITKLSKTANQWKRRKMQNGVSSLLSVKLWAYKFYSKFLLSDVFKEKWSNESTLQFIVHLVQLKTTNNLLYYCRANNNIDTILRLTRQIVLHRILICFHSGSYALVLLLQIIQPRTGKPKKQEWINKTDSTKIDSPSFSSMTSRQTLPFPILGITESKMKQNGGLISLRQD